MTKLQNYCFVLCTSGKERPDVFQESAEKKTKVKNQERRHFSKIVECSTQNIVSEWNGHKVHGNVFQENVQKTKKVTLKKDFPCFVSTS